jgi:hypothetical protein
MGVPINRLDDRTIDVRTDDTDPYFAEVRTKDTARVEQAPACFRAHGEARPVLLQFHDGERLKQAPRSAVLIPCLQDSTITFYVTTRSEARAVLERMIGKEARRWFRTPTWPTGYWTAKILRHHVELCECRTRAEMDRDPPADRIIRWGSFCHRRGRPPYGPAARTS